LQLFDIVRKREDGHGPTVVEVSLRRLLHFFNC